MSQASPQTLLHQASLTAGEYLREGARLIDDRFGSGYAMKHPELVAAFLQTCAIDFATGILAQKLSDIAHAIERSTAE